MDRPYTTSSLAMAAALSLRGIEWRDVETDRRGHVVFIYGRTPEVAATVEAYFDDTLALPARRFARAINGVREYIRMAKGAAAV